MQFSDRVYFRPNQNRKYGCCIFYENISLTQAPPSLFGHFHHNLTMQYSEIALQIHGLHHIENWLVLCWLHRIQKNKQSFHNVEK